MPCKNSEKTILRSVNSVLKSLTSNDELLIYDDGSSDETLGIIQSISDRRVKVFKGVSSMGPGPASNFLVNQAQNELISRFDSDDIALPNRFSGSLRRAASEEFDFVFSNMILFSKGWLIPQPPRTFSGVDLQRHLVHSNQLNNSSMVGKKEVFLNSGGYGEGVTEDKSLWLRMALQDIPMKLFRVYTVLYRVHPNQFSQRDKVRGADVIEMEKKLAQKMDLQR